MVHEVGVAVVVARHPSPSPADTLLASYTLCVTLVHVPDPVRQPSEDVLVVLLIVYCDCVTWTQLLAPPG